MGNEPSWRLKLRRANEHRDEVTELAEPFGQEHAYKITEGVEENGNLTYRIWTPIAINPYISAIFGDFLFNVRSALDHLAVANVPRSRQYSAFFPILPRDPDVVHPNDLNGDEDRRDAWNKATKGMRPDVVAVIRAHQPFSIEPPAEWEHLNLTADSQVLAILSAFQNADKHRKLATTIAGLVPTSVVFTRSDNGERIDLTPDSIPLGVMVPNGTPVPTGGRVEMHVEAKGTAELAARVSNNPRGPYRKLLDYMPELLRVVEEIVGQIEAV